MAVKIIIVTIVILTLSCFTSCSDSVVEDREFISCLMGFDIGGRYEIVENDEHIHFSDYNRTLVLQFEQNDFTQIVKKAKQSTWYDGVTKFAGIKGEFIFYDTLLPDNDNVSIVISMHNRTVKYIRWRE